MGTSFENVGKYHDAIEYFTKCYDLDVKLAGEKDAITAKPLLGLADN